MLHFNRYCGHLVGVRCEGYFPETVLDAWRILFMADWAGSYDSATTGTELVESFVPAFAPKASQSRIERMRAAYHYRVQAGYSGFVHAAVEPPPLRPAVPGAGHGATGGRAPLIAGVEVVRRVVPVWTSGGNDSPSIAGSGGTSGSPAAKPPSSNGNPLRR